MLPGSTAGTIATQRLMDCFAERGFVVIRPAKPAVESIPPEIRTTAEPETDALCRYGASVGADIVIAGISRLSRTRSDRLSSIEGMQCDMDLQVIDVWKKTVVIRSAAHALGLHIDETSAALDAVDKAARQVAGRIIDTIYLHLRDRHEYNFDIAFMQPVSETDVRAFLEAFAAVVPDIAFSNLQQRTDGRHWAVAGTGTQPGAAVIQRVLADGIPGYSIDIAPAAEDTVRFTVTPAEGQRS